MRLKRLWTWSGGEANDTQRKILIEYTENVHTLHTYTWAIGVASYGSHIWLCFRCRLFLYFIRSYSCRWIIDTLFWATRTEKKRASVVVFAIFRCLFLSVSPVLHHTLVLFAIRLFCLFMFFSLFRILHCLPILTCFVFCLVFLSFIHSSHLVNIIASNISFRVLLASYILLILISVQNENDAIRWY